MRGAQPVFVTPVSAIACEGSKARPTRGGFVTATLEAGESHDVPVVDLHERSIALYNEQGLCPIPGGSDVTAATGGKVGAFFCDDHTHFSGAGAEQIAQLMAQALKDEMLGLARYLK
jgi:lysophospholipase L1-like esterase